MKKLIHATVLTAALTLVLTGCARPDIKATWPEDVSEQEAAVEEVEAAPEPEPTGPTDEERAAMFDTELKAIFFIEESYQELLAQDATMWPGYITDIRAEGERVYVTLQVDRNTLEGKTLGEQAAQALSTLMTEEFVSKVDYSWIIVEDGTAVVIDQKQANPIL